MEIYISWTWFECISENAEYTFPYKMNGIWEVLTECEIFRVYKQPGKLLHVSVDLLKIMRFFLLRVAYWFLVFTHSELGKQWWWDDAGGGDGKRLEMEEMEELPPETS